MSRKRENIKRMYKINKKLRAALINNCCKSKFLPYWQGGYCGEIPDGGDVRYECHECDIMCIKI